MKYQIFSDMEKSDKVKDLWYKISIINSTHDFILHYDHENKTYVGYVVQNKKVLKKSFTTNSLGYLEHWVDMNKIKLATVR